MDTNEALIIYGDAIRRFSPSSMDDVLEQIVRNLPRDAGRWKNGFRVRRGEDLVEIKIKVRGKDCSDPALIVGAVTHLRTAGLLEENTARLTQEGYFQWETLTFDSSESAAVDATTSWTDEDSEALDLDFRNGQTVYTIRTRRNITSTDELPPVEIPETWKSVLQTWRATDTTSPYPPSNCVIEMNGKKIDVNDIYRRLINRHYLLSEEARRFFAETNISIRIPNPPNGRTQRFDALVDWLDKHDVGDFRINTIWTFNNAEHKIGQYIRHIRVGYICLTPEDRVTIERAGIRTTETGQGRNINGDSLDDDELVRAFQDFINRDPSGQVRVGHSDQVHTCVDGTVFRPGRALNDIQSGNRKISESCASALRSMGLHITRLRATNAGASR